MSTINDTLMEKLQCFEHVLRRNKVPGVKLLRPAISLEEILLRAASAGWRLPSPLVTWYAWHDGQDRSPPHASPGLVPELGPLTPLDTAFETAAFLSKLEARERERDPAEEFHVPLWSDRWWPLATHAHPAQLVFVVGPPFDGEVLYKDAYDPEGSVTVALSLEHLVERCTRVFEEGYLTWDSDRGDFKALRPRPDWCTYGQVPWGAPLDDVPPGLAGRREAVAEDGGD